jgi:hypothetical protein
MKKFTRREIAVAVSAASLLSAQAPAPPLPQNPDEELKAAKDQNAQNGQQLAKYEMAMPTEPAVHFRA